MLLKTEFLPLVLGLAFLCECTFNTKCPGKLICTPLRSCNDMSKKYRCAAGSVCCSSVGITGKSDLPFFLEVVGMELETSTVQPMLTSTSPPSTTTHTPAVIRETKVKPQSFQIPKGHSWQQGAPNPSYITTASRPTNPAYIHNPPPSHYKPQPSYSNAIYPQNYNAPPPTSTPPPQPSVNEKPIILDPILQSLFFGPSAEQMHLYSADIDRLTHLVPHVTNNIHRFFPFRPRLDESDEYDDNTSHYRAKRSAAQYGSATEGNSSIPTEEYSKSVESMVVQGQEARNVSADESHSGSEQEDVLRRIKEEGLQRRESAADDQHRKRASRHDTEARKQKEEFSTGRSGDGPSIFPYFYYPQQRRLLRPQISPWWFFLNTTPSFIYPNYLPQPVYAQNDHISSRSSMPNFYPINASPTTYRSTHRAPISTQKTENYETGRGNSDLTHDTSRFTSATPDMSRYDASRGITVEGSKPIVINMIQYQGIDLKLLEIMCQARTIAC